MPLYMYAPFPRGGRRAYARVITMSDDKERPTYEVGYKKPPKHGQIKPGERRSPGRPKGSKGLNATLRAMLNARVRVRVGDKIKTMSTLDAVAARLREKALQGDDKAIAQTFRFAQLVEAADAAAPKDDHVALSAADEAILRDYLEMHGAPLAEGETSPPNKEEGW